MKKKPNGFVSVLLALCLLLAPMTVFAESNAQLNYVTDDAGILTDSQWEDLEQRAQQVSEEYQCGVYMITVDDYTDYSTESVYTADYTIYHDYEMGMGEDRDGIMILLSMEDRDYAMFVYGPKASEVFNAYGQEQLETWSVTSVMLTPLARMVSISSGVKWRPAVGAAALPSSLA